MMPRILLSVFVMGLAAPVSWASSAPDQEYLVYFGTYTGFHFTRKGVPTGESSSKGIYVSRFRPSTGEVTEPELAAEIINPSFFVIDPTHRFLYALSEDPQSLGPSRDQGSFVSAYAIQPSTGKLRLLNTVPSGGTATCHISIDQTGQNVLVANFGSSSITVLRVNDDGSLGNQSARIEHTGASADPFYQTRPHPHSIIVSPDNRFVLVSDLGIDKVMIYRFDAATGSLTPNDPPFVKVKPGSGPRHFKFDPSGQFGYLINEMGGTLYAFRWDAARGTLREIQQLNLIPADFIGDHHSAEVAVHPSGKFLYTSSRGPETIGVWLRDPVTGTLEPIQQTSSRGLWPRDFEIDPTGTYLFVANQATDNVVVFHIQGETGRIVPTRQVVKLDAPVCVQFMPVGHETGRGR
jgi:6-phosphogluconolactonase